MAITKCPRCGSEKVMPNLQIRDNLGFGIKLEVEVEGNPNAMIFKKSRRSALKATVCGECGNVELSVNNPKQLWEHYSITKNT